ncbi:LL-diaminopimelate aminotransferase [Vacuolonema iberomarrocanum]|uniref:LL-diaminopimelate aminotransferase n=1 Tax=Vacuolonema iberomarrocanum TaxID=3454632 RepID=UPI0019DE6CDC|nr:LL-diaminopimelate aminotransferase [filamentous cyanobacterium LEGE 07170]
MQFADRLQSLKSNVFGEMDRAKAQARAAGHPIIDLSVGSSDLPTEERVLEAIAQSLSDPSTHGYLLLNGTLPFRQAAADWYTRKFGVSVDAETEVTPLIGSQEGTAMVPLALLNPGDFALVQDPSYPSHTGGVYLAGGQPYFMPLLAENNFLPVLEDIPAPVLVQAKLMVLSYPHNPTAAIAPLDFFQRAIAFCEQHNLVLAHDFPYPDLVFDGAPAPSVLQADPEKRRSIEFFSLSKSYNMGGFRVGYAIGNAALIEKLRQVKAVMGFNQYAGILNGAIAALSGPQDTVAATVQRFRERRDVLVASLQEMGWAVTAPPATMYIWTRLPERWAQDSLGFCTELVAQTGVAIAPGSGFGKAGEGYIRFALVRDPAALREAVAKMGAFIQSAL